MTPLAAKLILLLLAASLYLVIRMLFKGTMKGEVSAQLILAVASTPLIAIATLLLMIYLLKFAVSYA